MSRKQRYDHEIKTLYYQIFLNSLLPVEISTVLLLLVEISTGRGQIVPLKSAVFEICSWDNIWATWSDGDLNVGALESPRLDLSNALSTVAVSFTVFDIGSKTWSTRPKVAFLRNFTLFCFTFCAWDWKQPVTTSFSPADVNLGALDSPRLDLSYAPSTVVVSLTVFDIGSKTWSTRPKVQFWRNFTSKISNF